MINNTSKVTKIYHAAIYVRLSKEDGDVDNHRKAESDSISNQKSLIYEFLKDKKDIVVVSERVDDGYSGASFERPAFQMMLEDIKSGKIDCVIVKDLSRFGREYIDSGRYIERMFPALGVRFIAINDNYDSQNSNESSDEIMVPFKNLINDVYCRDISIKIRSHLEVKRKNGEYIGAFSNYGYMKDQNDKHRLVVDTYAADVVKDIFSMKMSGMSQDAIANRLNELGILSPLEYKHSKGVHIQTSFKKNCQAVWSAVSVKRILENEIYIGNLVQGKVTTPNHKIKKIVNKPENQWIRIKNNHEAIVSERTFEITKKLLGMDTRTSPNEENVYLLSGIATCAGCGNIMTRVHVPTGGKDYYYYVCSTHKKTKECKPHRITAKKLEDTVFELIKIHIEDVVEVKRIIGFIDNVPLLKIEQKKLEERKTIKEAEVIKCREIKASLYGDMKDGIVSKKDYIEIHDAYEERQKKAESELHSIKKKIADIVNEKDDKHEWLDYFTRYQNIKELTREIVVNLVSEVKVTDKNNIEVIFEYDDCFNVLNKKIEYSYGRLYGEGEAVCNG